MFGALADFEPSADLRQDLKQLALVRSRLDLLMSELAVSLCDSRIWEEDAYCSPIQWLREEARLPTGVAIQQLGVGLSRDRLAESVAAMERGEIGFGHLALIAETAPCYRDGGFEEGLFLEKAREQNLTQFRRTCEHARHAQDPRGFAESEREEHEQRSLKLSPSWVGRSGSRAGSTPRLAPGSARHWSRWLEKVGPGTSAAASSGSPTHWSRPPPASSRPSWW